MILENLIPEDKFDVKNIDKLQLYTFEELEPIIPTLLEWLQDGNWPVSRPLSKFLLTLPSEKLDPYIMKIMNSTDYEWKYFLISLMGDTEKYDANTQFHKEIVRISHSPTEIEIKCELQFMAKLVLE